MSEEKLEREQGYGEKSQGYGEKDQNTDVEGHKLRKPADETEPGEGEDDVEAHQGYGQAGP
ncbi:MAG: hypothetical protein WBB74_04055 [Gaiellaceae bacterium]